MPNNLEISENPNVEYIESTSKTYIVSSFLNISDEYRSYLIKETRKVSNKNTASNLTGDSTTFHLWEQMKCGELIDSIEQIANIPNLLPWIGSDLITGKQIPQVLKEAWSSIYRKKDLAKRHNHSHAITAFVYYLHSSEEEDSPLIFDDGTRIKPKQGKLVFFPGFLYHEVPTMEKDNERIVIAGNLFYKF